MEKIIEITPEAQQLATKAETMLKDYATFVVPNNETYVNASSVLKFIKTTATELDALRKSMTKPLDESKKRIMDFFRKPLNNLVMVENNIKKAMLTFQKEQERKRKEEEDRLLEQQRKDKEKLEKRADKAEEKGNTEKAETLREEAEQKESVVPTVAPMVEKVSGISTKKIWKFKIVDAKLIPREYLMPNEKMIGEVGRATKGTLKIAGIEFYSDETIAAGR